MAPLSLRRRYDEAPLTLGVGGVGSPVLAGPEVELDVRACRVRHADVPQVRQLMKAKAEAAKKKKGASKPRWGSMWSRAC